MDSTTTGDWRGSAPPSGSASNAVRAVGQRLSCPFLCGPTAGLTDGRPAITHHAAVDDLRAAGAEVVDARVVDDGDLVTAGGVTAGIDLVLHPLTRAFGADVMEAVPTLMEDDPSGAV